MVKNKIFSSGQVITVAQGQDYTLKDDEVYINNHTYKKRDLEIKLDTPTADLTQDNVRIGVRLRDGMKTLPADFALYKEWEVDGVVMTSLAQAIELITTCIYFANSFDTSGIENAINDTIRKDIELVPASVANPDGTRRLIAVEYSVASDGTRTLVGITEIDGTAISDGAVPLFPASGGKTKTEIIICSAEEEVAVGDVTFFGASDQLEAQTPSNIQEGDTLKVVQGNKIGYVTIQDATIYAPQFQLTSFSWQDENGNDVSDFSILPDHDTAHPAFKIVKEFTGSLIKEFDESGNEVVANRVFFKSGQVITEPSNWSEGACTVEEETPQGGRLNISDQQNIDGETGTITDPSSFSFVWGNNAAGSFTLTNTVTGNTTTYTASSGIAPSNAVDEGRFSLETHTFDASLATDLYLNVQGARISIN